MNSYTNQLQIKQDQILTLNYSMISDLIKFLDVKPKTIETYRRALKQFFLYLNSNEINQPQRDDIIHYRDDILSKHKTTTAQSYINAVKRFFTWTEQAGLYPDITKGVKNAKVERGIYRKDYLTADQLNQILEKMEQDKTAEGLRNVALFRLMVSCALRTIEIERANIEDLRTRGDHTVLYVQGKGKDGKDAHVNVSPKTERALRAYLSTRQDAKGTEPLFISTSNRNLNGRMSTRSMRQIIKTAMVEAGFNSETLTAHSLRHTGATLNLQAGADVTEVQQYLRHSDISNTMIYAHMMDMDNNQCSNRIDQLI